MKVTTIIDIVFYLGFFALAFVLSRSITVSLLLTFVFFFIIYDGLSFIMAAIETKASEKTNEAGFGHSLVNAERCMR